MKYKFRTKEACRIAGVNRDRFNEAVATNNYPCAPKVRRGATRVFDEDDLVAFFIYGRLLDDNHPPSVAGALACEVRECLLGMAKDDEVILMRTSGGFYEAFRKSEIVNENTPIIGGSYVYWRINFNVGNIREIIRREAEEELNTIGADDEGDDK